MNKESIKLDPLEYYYFKGLKATFELLFKEGQSLYITEVSSLLKLSINDVIQLTNQNKLLKIKYNNVDYIYPSCQFVDNKPIEGLDLVINILNNNDITGISVLCFLISGDIRLDGHTPLDRLKKGEIDRVVWCASCYGIHSCA